MQLPISSDEELSIAKFGGVNKLYIHHEEPKKCLTFNVTGDARMHWVPGTEPWGDYTLTKEKHRDRPVYRNSKGKYLSTMDSGAWGVSITVGNSEPPYRSTDRAPSPALCKNWEYRKHGDSEYKPGDITVTVKE